MKKILIIRFSSLGDIIQSLSVVSRLKDLDVDPQNTEIHWLTREDFAAIIKPHPKLNRVWTVSRKDHLLQFWQLAKELRKENFTHIYDAHNNLRSRIFSLLLFSFSQNFIRKSQKRWQRFLLFRFRINHFRQPFSGQRDLLEPLKKWNLSEKLPPPPQIFSDSHAIESVKKKLSPWPSDHFLVLAPSAAHPLKRWPLKYWIELIDAFPQEYFVITGGPSDIFLDEISQKVKNASQILNLSGKTNYQETIALIQLSKALITNDTGVMHIAEQLGKPAIALMGPAPFGFPSRPSTHILEVKLDCRPCSKHGQGPCTNPIYHRCMIDIKPSMVMQKLKEDLLP